MDFSLSEVDLLGSERRFSEEREGCNDFVRHTGVDLHLEANAGVLRRVPPD